MSPARTDSALETERLGGRLAAGLKPGDLVLVSGELGAGKTTFVRGAMRALGVEGPVVSPTFTIGRRYEGSGGLQVSHLDLYRLADLGNEDPGLLADYLTPDAIALVEWPGVGLAELGEPTMSVEIRHTAGDAREIDVRTLTR